MPGESSFASLLRALRAESGLTQEEIAERSGLSVRAIGDLERGTVRRPQRKTVELLVAALGVTGAAADALTEAARAVRRAVPGGESALASGAEAVARQLPSTVRHFVGREAEMAAVLRSVERESADEAGAAGAAGAAAQVLAIDGMAGVGKTALAVAAGHALAGRYPDGQLFLDLHGHTPGREPVPAHAALVRLLRTLGVRDEHLADDPEELAELWRNQASERRLLIVLDNAADAAHVRPLIPGGGSLVLVTSRLRLIDLDVSESVSLDVLPAAQARRLLADGAGAERVAGQEADLGEAARLCGHLPLAIRIAAAQLRHRPSWRVADLIESLGESAAEGRGQVAAAFEMSYRALEPAQQRMFRLLALHRGSDIEVFAAAALAGLPRHAARRLLESLLDHHMIEQHVPGRYALHDLMREYARGESSAVHDDRGEREASDRLCAHYLATSSAAMNVIAPATSSRRPSVARPETDAPQFADAAQAAAWLEAERGNLLAAAVLAAEQGRAAHAIRFSQIIWRDLYNAGCHLDALTVHELAVAAARQQQDTNAHAKALRYYGLSCVSLGRFPEALAALEASRDMCEDPNDLAAALELLGNLGILICRYEDAAEHYDRALALWREQDNAQGVGNDLGNLGIVYFWLGRYAAARAHVTEALTVHGELGHPASQAQSLVWLGVVAERTGEYDAARAHADRALELAGAHNLPSFEADALEVRGLARLALGQSAESIADLQGSLEIRRAHGNQPSLVDSLLALGTHHHRHGEHERALDYFQQALYTTSDIGMPGTEAAALTGLGEALTALGRAEPALAHHRRALETAQPLGDPYRIARAHEGFGFALRALGDHEQAEEHLRQALDAFARLGVPDTERISTVPGGRIAGMTQLSVRLRLPR